MSLLRISSLLLTLHCSQAFGQEGIPQLPAAARNEVINHCPSFSGTVDVALGNLDGDGINDVAAIVQCVENGSELNKIVVLTGTANGSFVFEMASASWEPHMRRNEYISIKQKAVHATASTNSYTDYSGTLYKFARRGGVFVLTGLEYSEGQIGEGGGSGISANFLTYKLIAWTKSSKGKKQSSQRNLRNDYKIPFREFALGDALDARTLR